MDSDVHFRRKARQLLVEGIMAADAIGASPGQTVDDAAANFAAPLSRFVWIKRLAFPSGPFYVESPISSASCSQSTHGPSSRLGRTYEKQGAGASPLFVKWMIAARRRIGLPQELGQLIRVGPHHVDVFGIIAVRQRTDDADLDAGVPRNLFKRIG